MNATRIRNLVTMMSLLEQEVQHDTERMAKVKEGYAKLVKDTGSRLTAMLFLAHKSKIFEGFDLPKKRADFSETENGIEILLNILPYFGITMEDLLELMNMVDVGHGEDIHCTAEGVRNFYYKKMLVD